MSYNLSKKEIQKTDRGGRPVTMQQFSIGKVWLLIAGILLLTFIAFLPSLKNDFVNWDDYSYIRDNPVIKDVSSKNIKNVFNISTHVLGNYHPLTILSFCLEYSFFKLNPFYYHFDNILLHLLNVILVFVFIKMLITLPSAKGGIKKTPLIFSFRREEIVAAITALLFAIHPLRVESVTWVSERKDVLYTLFFLAALCYYLVYLKTLKAKHYLVALLLFVCSLLSKGQAVVLAPVLLLIDNYRNRKLNSRLIFEKIPFFALAVFFGIIAMIAQNASVADHRPDSYTLPERFVIANYGILMYIHKFFLPINLSSTYQYPDTISGLIFLSPLIVIALAFGAWRLSAAIFFQNKKEDGVSASPLLFGSLFFLITVSIVLQFISVGSAIIAERYTYIPYIGFFFIVSEIYTRLLEKKAHLKNIFLLSGTAVVAVLFILTFNQTMVWKDSKTLWTTVLKNRPYESVAYNGLGVAYLDEKQYDLALEETDKAISYNKRNFFAWKNKGVILRRLGRYDEATVAYKASLAIRPGYADAMFGLGGNYLDAGKVDSALMYSDMAFKAEPGNPEIYYNKGIAFRQTQKWQEAIENFTKALELNTIYKASAYKHRGLVYTQIGEQGNAMNDFQNSLKLDSSNADTWNEIASIYLKQGFADPSKQEYPLHIALDYFNRSLKIDPDFAPAYCNRGALYARTGNNQGAIDDCSTAIKLSPKFHEAYYFRAIAYYNLGNKEEACNNLHQAATLGNTDAMPVITQFCK